VSGTSAGNGKHLKVTKSTVLTRDGRTRRTAPAPLISVIVPTRDEAGNVEELVARLEQVLPRERLEIIFVDDSSDDTPDVIAAVAKSAKRSVRLIHRPVGGRAGGLGGAVVEGIREARAPWVCVMDGDLQHPPELIADLFEQATAAEADLVVASRYTGDGAASTFGPLRAAVSKLTGALARGLFPIRLRRVSDPMSGFFFLRRDAIRLERLRPQGFKILLEIVVRTGGLRIAEVPFQFGTRHSGESKASLREGFRYLGLLARLRLGELGVLLTRFGLVGLSGLVVNTALLAALTEVGRIHYLVSAVLATQGSTLWNFVLTDRWVFAGRIHRRSPRSRAAMFFVMNNAALLLRVPLLAALATGLGLNYLVANVISLAVLMLTRYAVADTWIWRGSRAAEAGAAAKAATFNYDIHGLVTVSSEVRLPELERFRVASLMARPTVRVQLGKLSKKQSDLVAALAFITRHCRYDEGLGRFGFGVEICVGKSVEVVASPMLRFSPHVLYTNVVEPILRWSFVKKGYALVHAACVASGDEAYLVTARTDTGKTTTLLKLLDAYDCSFLSDDLTLISPTGTVLSYPKPLTISRHTVSALRRAALTPWERLRLFYQSRVHSRSGRRFAMLLATLRLPVATINAIVQLLIPPPKYHVERLIPGVDRLQTAKISGLTIIQRGGEGEERLASHDALEMLFGNCEDAFGFPPYPAIEAFLRHNGSGDLREIERGLIARALDGVPATLLKSETMDWWERLPSLMRTAPTPRQDEHSPFVQADLVHGIQVP
jgi:glycosyltransferase involved in cell wall biosynthesis